MDKKTRSGSGIDGIGSAQQGSQLALKFLLVLLLGPLSIWHLFLAGGLVCSMDEQCKSDCR